MLDIPLDVFPYTLVLLKLKENHQDLKHLLYSQSFHFYSQLILKEPKLNTEKKAPKSSFAYDLNYFKLGSTFL
mgnify:CR=1 FL=1